MKRTFKQNLAAILIVIIWGNVSWGVEYDFRKTIWGMSKDHVKRIESIKPYSDECISKDPPRLDYLAYADISVLGKKVHLSYTFLDNRLIDATYVFYERHLMDSNEYIVDFKVIKKALTSKYGKPKEDNVFWWNPMFRDRPGLWGMAIRMGDLKFHSSWETQNTAIVLVLERIKSENCCSVYYYAKNYHYKNHLDSILESHKRKPQKPHKKKGQLLELDDL